MKTILLFAFSFTALACATTPAPAPVTTPATTSATTPAATPPAVAATTSATAPCDPGHSLLNATLWVQTSAEYRAATTGIFANAQLALDRAMDNPFEKGATEETSNDPTQPPAVILDLDETVLDNSEFEARAIRAHTTYDRTMWKNWTKEGAARAIPGAKEFLDHAKLRGVTVFYITNRDLDEEEGTRRNLEALGFPFDPKVDTLLMQGENGWTTSDKSPRRAHVAASYRILLVLGDDLNDFTSTSGKTVAQRDEIVANMRGWWGLVWFVIPNPMYGSWERAAITPGDDPCGQVQKKVNALR